MSRIRRSEARRRRVRPPYKIFLSHSNRDQWLAEVLLEKFKAAGVGVWVDEMSLQGGDQVLESILRGIRGTNETVVLVSDASLHSQWVATEVGIAAAMKKRVTPVLNNVEPDELAPLKGLKSYELNAFPKLVFEVRRRARSL